MEKHVTIVTLLSRIWCLDDVIRQINELETGLYKINILIIVDNIYINTLELQKRIKYPVDIIKTGNAPTSSISVPLRRQRITELMEMIKSYLPQNGFMFMFEDDTIFKKDTLINLMADHLMLKRKKLRVGMISGLQAGRWGVKMIGAWKVNDINNPTEYVTIKYEPLKKFREVDATGFYCFIVENKIIKQVTFKHDYFGPDVNCGLDIRRLGYRNFVDWKEMCGHKTQFEVIKLGMDCVQLTYIKYQDTFIRQP